jgi:hypothetical protein
MGPDRKEREVASPLTSEGKLCMMEMCALRTLCIRGGVSRFAHRMCSTWLNPFLDLDIGSG